MCPGRTGFLARVALFVGGAVLDTMIASMELSDEDRDLRNLLRDTEFGTEGYPRAFGPTIRAAPSDVKHVPADDMPTPTLAQAARWSPVRDLYESGGRLAPQSPKTVRDHLLGLPWRAFPALLPLAPDAPGKYVEGIVVRLMPLPAPQSGILRPAAR